MSDCCMDISFVLKSQLKIIIPKYIRRSLTSPKERLSSINSFWKLNLWCALWVWALSAELSYLISAPLNFLIGAPGKFVMLN